MTHVYSSVWGPADAGITTATLYKGGHFVDTKSTGELNGVEHFGIWITASSSFDGEWQGIGWHWVSWPAEGIEESLTTYDPELISQLDKIEEHHQQIIDLYLPNHNKWSYANPITLPSLKDQMLHTPNNKTVSMQTLIRLEVALHMEVLPSFLESGDYMPFILVDPLYSKAIVAIGKMNGGSLLVVELVRIEDNWTITRTDTHLLHSVRVGD